MVMAGKPTALCGCQTLCGGLTLPDEWMVPGRARPYHARMETDSMTDVAHHATKLMGKVDL
jgi:hypothetical protein